jgi:plastocyanin
MSFRSAILLAALVAAAACSDDNGDGGQGPDETPEGDIQVRNNLFDPAEFQAAPGATVVWAWASGGVTHNVTFADGEASDNLSSGTYQRTFAAAGTFPYHCTFHGTPTSGMRGVVTIAEGESPGEGGDSGGDGDDGGDDGDDGGDDGPIGY